jgi:ElaB/YqjD/DUF883 family membrane-anchored ribosome-binding protein
MATSPPSASNDNGTPAEAITNEAATGPTGPTVAPGPMHAAIDHASDAASAAARHVSSGLSAVCDTVNQRVDGACELGAEYAESVRATVQARPLRAVLAALGIGLLVGRLCR